MAMAVSGPCRPLHGRQAVAYSRLIDRTLPVDASSYCMLAATYRFTGRQCRRQKRHLLGRSVGVIELVKNGVNLLEVSILLEDTFVAT